MWGSLDGIQDFPPDRKNLFRLPIHRESNLRGNEIPAGALQQLLAQMILEAFQLRAHGWGSETQLLTGFRDAACADDRPKIKEVMIVQPFHCQIILRKSLIVSSKVSNCPKIPFLLYKKGEKTRGGEKEEYRCSHRKCRPERRPYYAYIKRHLHLALGRFAAKLGRASVRVEDVPGPGNIPNASCRIQVQLLPTGVRIGRTSENWIGPIWLVRFATRRRQSAGNARGVSNEPSKLQIMESERGGSMEPATIAVIIITGAFLGLCVWIERNSRRQRASPERVEAVEEDGAVTEQERAPQRPRRHRRFRS